MEGCLEINGKWYLRVTHALKPFSDLKGVPKEILQNKGDIGTKTHLVIEDFIKGEIALPESDTVGYFQSFQKWWDSMNPLVVESEMRRTDDAKMLTGCIDAVVKFQGKDEAIIVDWKTSANESPTWILQGHLYHYLLSQNGIVTSPRVLFIKLDKKGGDPKVFSYMLKPSIMKKALQAVDDAWNKMNCTK